MPPSPGDPSQSMEDVWKDIKLASLYDCSLSSSSSSTTTTTTTTTTTHSAVRRLILHEFLSGTFNKDSPPTSTFLGSQELHQPTLLSLSSGSDFPKQSALGSSTICPSTTKKRTHQYIYDPTDSRHKRMIKNRESAARSRAKKQAYTHQLEHELAHLRQENARLRRQQEKHFWLRPSDQHPQKSTLHRTSTAPF